MSKFNSSIVLSAVLAAAGAMFGCTANVENPNVDQTGRSGDTVAVCTKSCDDTLTTCTGKCTEDSCRVSCQTDHDGCRTKCTAVKPDGG